MLLLCAAKFYFLINEMFIWDSVSISAVSPKRLASSSTFLIQVPDHLYMICKGYEDLFCLLSPTPTLKVKMVNLEAEKRFSLESVAGICGIFFSSTGRRGWRCFSWPHQFGKEELLSTLSFLRKARGICSSTTWPVIRKGVSLFALPLKLGGKCLLTREQNGVVWLLVYDLVSIWILLRTLRSSSGEELRPQPTAHMNNQSPVNCL